MTVESGFKLLRKHVDRCDVELAASLGGSGLVGELDSGTPVASGRPGLGGRG